MLLSSLCFGLYSSRVIGQQIARTVLKLFNFYTYIIFGVGGGGSKNYQEIEKGR